MEKGISCSVGSLAFIVSIGFIYSEKVHINSLRASASYVITGIVKKTLISPILKGTESLLEGGQSSEEQTKRHNQVCCYCTLPHLQE